LIANHCSHEKQVIQGVRQNSEEQTKKLQNTSNIKTIQVGNISRRAVKRILQNIKEHVKKEKKKKNYCKIPFPPHSRSLRTRAERCQRIINPVQKNAVYDVQQWREKKIK
jgi:hypothetical protein